MCYSSLYFFEFNRWKCTPYFLSTSVWSICPMEIWKRWRKIAVGKKCWRLKICHYFHSNCLNLIKGGHFLKRIGVFRSERFIKFMKKCWISRAIENWSQLHVVLHRRTECHLTHELSCHIDGSVWRHVAFPIFFLFRTCEASRRCAIPLSHRISEKISIKQWVSAKNCCNISNIFDYILEFTRFLLKTMSKYVIFLYLFFIIVFAWTTVCACTGTRCYCWIVLLQR